MKNTALIVVDFQNDYFPGGRMELSGIEAASRNGLALLKRFRDAEAPTIIIRHLFQSPDAPFFAPDTKGSEIHDSMAPTDRDRVIVKHQVNSFQGTSLLEDLKDRQIEEVVICGAMSHMCIDGTARAAADFGLKCTVVHDACATCDQEFNGVKVAADQVHAASMAALGFAYAEIASTDEVLSRY